MTKTKLSAGARSSALTWVAVCLALVATAVAVKSPPNLKWNQSSEVTITGRISDELLSLVQSESSPTVRLGSHIVPSNSESGTFDVKGRNNAVGLLTAESDGREIGWAVIPKDSESKDVGASVSLESTALSLVLMTPGIATSSPVGMLAISEVISTYESFESLVSSLRQELREEGLEYLDKLSPRTTDRLTEVIASASRPSGMLGAALAMRHSSIGGQADNCDVGIDSEYRKSVDNVCVEVKGEIPNTGRPDKLTLNLTNRSPRWVVILTEDDNSTASFVEVLAPREWSFPELHAQAAGIASRVLGISKEDFTVKVLTEGETEIELSDYDNSHLLTLTFGNSKSAAFDSQIDRLELRQIQNMTMTVTTITEFIIPVLEIVLDWVDAGKDDSSKPDCTPEAQTKALVREILSSNEFWKMSIDIENGAFANPIEMIAGLLSDEFLLEILITYLSSKFLDDCITDGQALVKGFSSTLRCPIIEDSKERLDCSATSVTEGFMYLIKRYLLKDGTVVKGLLKKFVPGESAYRLYLTAPGIQGLTIRSADLYTDIGKFGYGDSYSIESVFGVRFCGNLRAALRPYTDLSFKTSGPPLRKLVEIPFWLKNAARIGSPSFYAEQIVAWSAVRSTVPDSLESDAELIMENIVQIGDIAQEYGPRGLNILSSDNRARIGDTVNRLKPIVAETERPVSNLILYYRTNCQD